MDMKQKIIDFSKSVHIDAIGFCRAELDRQRDDLDNAPDLKHILPAAKSFIVILQSYSLELIKGREHELSGTVSRAAVFEDYHRIVSRKLEQLKSYLKDEFKVEGLIYCDRSPFSDRDLAVKAGLGVIGKNSFLMNQSFGTATFVGYVLTDLEFEGYDEPLQVDLCGDCKLCIKACPNHAILPERQIDAPHCISYLTQAKVIDEDLKATMNKALYGCDICQLSCPYNQQTHNQAFEPLISSLFSLEAVLAMDNKTFKSTFEKTAAGWRGKKTLQRNAIIALGEIGTQECVNVLKRHIIDSREDIRMEIVQALIRIGSNKAQEVLKEILLREESEVIRQRIQYTLK